MCRLHAPSHLRCLSFPLFLWERWKGEICGLQNFYRENVMSKQLLLSTLVLELHKVYCERRKVKRLPEGEQAEAYRSLQRRVDDLCRPYWGDLSPHPLEEKFELILGHNHVNTPCLEG